ncbi:MAG: AAA family ATPase [Acidobacteria bacterium]|nr:MAG: AAA family ATPase [Acidobacteriota bacterium]PIE90878.1 MAG: AAA family ATPase [Acidobacteriota bacterium]
MVFLGGPRQVGKTTVALQLLDGDENHPGYFNWDYDEDKQCLLKGQLPSKPSLIVLDEIHKYKAWRNFIKGMYDKNKSKKSFLITGSARLDYYRKGGDSLQGRYHYHRLHPFSLYEVNKNASASDLRDLLMYGGFPEPFLAQSERRWKRWQRERISRVIKEDLLSLEQVKEVSQLELLALLLKDRVASLLSINSIREDLQASHEAVDRWVTIFENLYYCFRIRPYGSRKIQALKKDRKLYLWDWSLCNDMGSKFENLVAANLLKYCHFIEDNQGDDMELCYLRDKYKREVDFVVMKNKEPLFAVECKTGQSGPAQHIAYFAQRTPIPQFYQVHMGTRDYQQPRCRTRVMPFTDFVKEVLLI